MSVAPGPAPAAVEIGAPLADVSTLAREAAHRVVAGRYRPRDATVRRVLAGCDAAAVAVVLLAVRIRSGSYGELVWDLPLPACWVLLCRAYGLYDGDIKRFTRGVLQDLPGVVHAALVGAVLYAVYATVLPLEAFDATHGAVFALVLVPTALALRVAGRRLMQRALGPERAIIVGDSASIPLLARKLRTHPEYGVELVGVVTDDAAEAPERVPSLGPPATLDLAAVASSHAIDRVILAGAEAVRGTVAELVRSAHRLGLKVDYSPHPLDVLGVGVEVDDIEGVMVFGLYPPVLGRSSRWAKRAMDVLGAATLLVLSAPLMVVIAVAVKLDSRGPVLFQHERIGKAGRRFRIAKFRTMVRGAEAMTDDLRRESRDPHWLLLDHDPRVTRLGRTLRLTSLDELPQLWSVLKGDMSLVGPRPLIEAEDRQIVGWGRGRLDLTPGLTGLWQVLGRTSIPFEEMVKLDYIYVSNWSAWRDVQLLLRTLPVLLTRRGAN
jgi:exopolysaccharide biosynthesis polyprenyl glycosylphosphotransferase